MKHSAILIAGLVLAPAPALADPIEGDWFTPMKETVRIERCGAGWCATIRTGQYAGVDLGTFTGTDGSYKARIREPRNGRSGDAEATVEGSTLRIRGCVTRLVCASRTWKRL